MDDDSFGSSQSEDPYIPSGHSLLEAAIFAEAPEGGIIPGRPPLMDPKEWERKKHKNEGDMVNNDDF